MRRLVLAALLGVGLAAPARADLDDAVAAFDVYDYVAAYKELRPLADGGDPVSQYYLGYMYYYGLGVPADYVEAYEWMRKSAEQDDPDAQTFLGDLLYFGEGVPQNFERAAHWYEKAAEQDRPYAEYSLALMRIYGEGLPKAPEEGAAVLRALAEDGLAYAQTSLGHLYETGNGVPQDLAQARAWYLKAAEQGDVRGFGNLGRIYAEGIGVAPDLPQAYAWWSRAAAASGPGPDHDHAVRQRNEMAAQLTSGRLAAAQAMTSGGLSEAVGPVAAKATGDRRSLVRAGFAKMDSQPPRKLELESSGTGIVVSGANDVLTNHHVVGDCAEVRVARAGGKGTETEIVATDPDRDLALLRDPGFQGSGRAADYATFRGRQELHQGEGVAVVGFPLRGILAPGVKVSTGVVSALADAEDETGLMQISSPVQAGNSGSPVLDMSGNVVGVVTSKLDAMEIADSIGDLPQNVNFATAKSAVLDFLEANGVAAAMASSERPVAVTEIVERAKRFTVLVECWN